MKLYDRPGFPNPVRIRIVLTEKKFDDVVEFVSVDLIGAEQKQTPFLAKNRACVLPGTTPREKAMIHIMQRRVEAELIDAVGTYFHQATPGLGPPLQAYKEPTWGDRPPGASSSATKRWAAHGLFR